jgi:RHS repeat-associated protein
VINSNRIVQIFSLLMMLGTATVYGQNPYTVETRPPRGFMPTADQLTSPVDSIDPISGKLHFEIPLASMPRGRAGNGFDLNLVYDSHLYDLVPEILQPPSNLNVDPEVAWYLSSYSTGGWHYNIDNLRLDIEGHAGAIDYYPDCTEESPKRVYRLRVPMLDGSLHTMQLRGYGAAMNDNYSGDGFFGIYPLTGRSNVCAALHHDWPSQLTGWLSYYSIDGSYLKLEIYVDGSGNMNAAPFYIYYPDGQRAIGHGFNIEALYDANGNGIHFSGHCVDEFCNQMYKTISDDAGHEVTLFYNSGGLPYGTWQADRTDTITVEGPNGIETSTVNWMPLSLGWQNRRTYWWSEASWNHTRPFLQMMSVVKYVQLPLLPAVPSNDIPPVWNSYAFGYADDSDGGYGEVDSMRTPTGSIFQYRYLFEGGLQDAMTIAAANSVRERKVSHDGITDLVWTYDGGFITNPDGSVTHYWAGPQGSFLDSGVSGTFDTPVVYRIDEPDGTVRKRVWSQNVVPGTVNQFPLVSVPVQNPWIRRETTTIGDASGNPTLTSVTDRMIDKNGNLVQATEYDWVNYNPNGAETGTVPVRTTEWKFYASVPNATMLSSNAYAYWNPHTPGSARRLNAVQRKDIGDASGNKASVSELVYDDAFSAGNVTSELHWDSVKSASAPGPGLLSLANSQVLTRSYDAYGNITDVYEPEIRTHITYDGTGSVPIRVDYAYQTAQQRSWQYDWKVSSGTLNSKTDMDNNITTSYAYDTVGRLLLTNEAGLRRAETIYDDANLRIIVKKDLNSLGDGLLQNSYQYDQLGRAVLVSSAEPGNRDGIKVKSTYYPIVNRSVHSSPYRTTSDATLEWTCTQTDASMRVIAVATFKGAAEPTDCASTTNRTGITSKVYNANQITLTDAASKQSRQFIDGVGRLTKVIEDPNGLNYSTTYSYDLLGNLQQVSQGLQIRTFNYSSLGRLLSATNPESGVLSYTYSENGDLLARADGRGIVTTITYDAMHHVRAKSFSGDAGVTPNVTYAYYDAGSSAPNVGQLQSMSSSAAIVSYGRYDVLGRIESNTQTTNGNAFTFQYSYRLNDSLSGMQFPSGKTLNYSVDDAGRTNKISTGLKTYADLTGLSSPFTADGRIAQMKLGNGLWESHVFQTPGSPTLFKLGTTANANDKLELEYDYSPTANNGNLATQVIRQPGHIWTQNYTYDSINRLATAIEANGFSRTYGYDQYGNRWVAASSGITAADTHEPIVGTLFNAANNRLANQSYDSAGNQTSYPPRTLAYDAENRLISATSPVNGNEYYLYDGDGRRVRKTWTPNGGSTQITTYVYGPGGKLAAEYTNQIAAGSGTSWMFTDLLGSIRAVTGEKPQSGSAPMTECYDYLPFGRMLSSSDNSRNTGCYPLHPDFSLSSGESPKFTGKERDIETGLDFFGARYFSAAQGRFLGGDGMITKKEWMPEPQRWNRYTYGLNNPLKYVDPDGKDAIAAFIFGPEYRKVSTFELLFGEDARADYKKAWSDFLDDHRTLTHGLSPIPTTRAEVGMQMIIPVGGKVVGPALEEVAGKILGDIGKTVLGKTGSYEKLASELGANRFSIPTEIWKKMSEAERWTANQKFLDRMIMRGDEIILSDPVTNIDDVRGYFRKELDYLISSGFKLSADGLRMTR